MTNFIRGKLFMRLMMGPRRNGLLHDVKGSEMDSSSLMHAEPSQWYSLRSLVANQKPLHVFLRILNGRIVKMA